jgi:hypothetical protein
MERAQKENAPQLSRLRGVPCLLTRQEGAISVFLSVKGFLRK